MAKCPDCGNKIVKSINYYFCSHCHEIQNRNGTVEGLEDYLTDREKENVHEENT